jgi:hypothetical protein
MFKVVAGEDSIETSVLPMIRREDGSSMNSVRTMCAQLMDFVPWSTFDRIVASYHGHRSRRAPFCAAQLQVVAFA